MLDSVDAKVDRLVHSELNAGLRTLEQAARGTSEQVHLLREARAHFNKAVTLEMGYRQVVALLALSVCHHWLGDKSNCIGALDEILTINPVTTLKLVITEGRSLIRENIRDANPFTLPKRVRQMREAAADMAISGRGIFQIPQDVFRGHPMVRYGKLVFSEQARKEYKRALVLRAVDTSEEASAIRRVQESVSDHVGRPVSWLEALEFDTRLGK